MHSSPDHQAGEKRSSRSKISAALIGTALTVLPSQVNAQQIYGQVSVELGRMAWHNLENTGRTPPTCTHNSLNDFPDIRCESSRSTLSAELPLGAIHGIIGYRETHWGLALSTTLIPVWKINAFPGLALLAMDVVASYRPRERSLWSLNGSVGVSFFDPSFMSTSNLNPTAALGASLYTSRTNERPRGVFNGSCGVSLFPNRPSFGVDAFCTLAAGIEIQ